MSVKKNSVTEILYTKVFTNQHLLENILSYLSDDFSKNLDVRLVNKSINNTFLRLIRRNHRTMKIEYAYNTDDVIKLKKNYIYINYRKISQQDVLPYFIFLNTAVGVKVRKITTRKLWMLKDKFKQRLQIQTRGRWRSLAGLQRYIRDVPRAQRCSHPQEMLEDQVEDDEEFEYNK